MGIEIERKFLVTGEAWRGRVRGAGMAMRQGYLAAGGASAPGVRVRLAGDQAWLTVKGPGGLVRAEFEYPIPVEDARGMLALCIAPIIEKTRFEVPHSGHLWIVDVFHGPAHLAGLVLAEIEMDSADASPPLPDWLGAEVTGDARYSNAALVAALQADRSG